MGSPEFKTIGLAKVILCIVYIKKHDMDAYICIY